jgi:xylitol oxidase
MYRARRLHRPRSVEEVQEIVRRASSVRALGSRHSFNDIVDTPGELVWMVDMPRRIRVDPRRLTVEVDGATRYGDVAAELEPAGFALHNLASLPHISVAGACATGTHGSGDGNGNLSTAMTAMTLVRGDGELETISRTSDDTRLDGAGVALGALGVVTGMTLRVEPTYMVRQDVYEHLPIDAFASRFADIAGSADSVSFFTDWRQRTIDQVWVKRRVAEEAASEPVPNELFGAALAVGERHPIRGLSPDQCTPQSGVPGAWHERLPHFRMNHTPSSGRELQSEYFVPRGHAVDAFLALYALRGRIAALIQVSEIRTVAADDLWLSEAEGRHSAAFHFTWRQEPDAVLPLLEAIEAALAPFTPRPHWAKLFTMPPEQVRSSYDRLPRFVELADQLDPDRKFVNPFVGRYVHGEAPQTPGTG